MNTAGLSFVGATILIVDSTRDNLRLLAGILTEHGFHVRPVTSGSRAIAIAHVANPDLIMLDVMMPDMDGYAVCEALKADPQTQGIPIIFISTLSQVFDKVQAFAVGGVDYITKPFYVEEVLARVQMHISLRRMHKQLQEQNAHLQREVDERAQIENQLRDVNSRLEHTVHKLEQRTHEMLIINRLNTMLQQTQTMEALWDYSLSFLSELFPRSSGAVYIDTEGLDTLEKIIAWGKVEQQTQSLTLTQCWALAGQKVHLVEAGADDLACEHCNDPATFPALCVQIRSGSLLHGLLQICQLDSEEVFDAQRLAMMVADLLGLHLSNLQMRENLRQQALLDPLTGLYNRRFLDEYLERELADAFRHRRMVSVMMLDIDYFKKFNDTYGHDGGDLVLRELALLLKASVRTSDLVCRYGGEEITVVLPESTLPYTEQRAQELCQKTRTLSVNYNGQTLPMITISLGVAIYPMHGITPDEIITAADQALYRAKTSGRNRVCIAESPERC